MKLNDTYRPVANLFFINDRMFPGLASKLVLGVVVILLLDILLLITRLARGKAGFHNVNFRV